MNEELELDEADYFRKMRTRARGDVVIAVIFVIVAYVVRGGVWSLGLAFLAGLFVGMAVLELNIYPLCKSLREVSAASLRSSEMWEKAWQERDAEHAQATKIARVFTDRPQG